MSGDSDVVRCASPWPGKAAVLLEALAELGEGQWSVEHICRSSGIGIAGGDAVQILSGLAIAGACVRCEQSSNWSTHLNREEAKRLATLLRGADHYRRLRTDAPSFELAVTMPMLPSHLNGLLPSTSGRPGGYLSTKQAFTRIAAAAQERLVIMVPFINHHGFDWMQSVFRTAGSRTDRILIVRNAEDYFVEFSLHQSDWLRELGISIYDYHLDHPPDSGRALPMETFHAKILLADDCLAYVGSANMLGSGDGTSLEAGFLVDGKAANHVARLVDGVLSVARSL